MRNCSLITSVMVYGGADLADYYCNHLVEKCTSYGNIVTNTLHVTLQFTLSERCCSRI